MKVKIIEMDDKWFLVADCTKSESLSLPRILIQKGIIQEHSEIQLMLSEQKKDDRIKMVYMIMSLRQKNN